MTSVQANGHFVHVVDDESVIALSLATILTQAGYEFELLLPVRPSDPPRKIFSSIPIASEVSLPEVQE